MMHIGPYYILKARMRINQIVLFVTTALCKQMSDIHKLCALVLLKYLLQTMLLDSLQITMVYIIYIEHTVATISISLDEFKLYNHK